jgi:hypothetical protein
MLPKSERISIITLYVSFICSRHSKTVISVIVSPTHHSEMDGSPPIATLFLHEDLVARTLAFELDLKQWRLAEIEAGRGDPGRPNYLNAFSVSDILCPPVQF